jgi:hypothetical protein
MSDLHPLVKKIDSVRFNPSGIQRAALDLLEEITNGERLVVDPSNPFVYLLESAASFAAAGMINDEAVLRRQYAIMATTEEELYLHMSDKDHINRFATPATAPFYVLLSKEEVYAKAVESGVSGVRKLVIPRNTEFSVAGYTFTMQYPVEIRIMSHGGLQIVYDVERPSPLQVLSSNVVNWDIVTLNKVDFIRIQLPVLQFKIDTYYGNITPSSVFNKTYELPDDFYFCRVYHSKNDGSWEEIVTTHTDQVFDPLTPTAVLSVYNRTLRVKIPQVYQTTNLVNRELRIDIYTTKGPVDIILSNYLPESFSVRWVDLDGDVASSQFSAPLASFTTMGIYSDAHVVGGSKALTFEQLRERVLNNAFGNSNLPITNVQVGNLLNDIGYDVVKNVDTVTNRIFLATRRLPRPTNESVASGAATSINTVSFKIEELSQLKTVKDNGERVTLLPETLYENLGGLVRVVSDIERESLLSESIDVLANKVNQGRYLYSPFHYVFDSTNNGFDSRPYYLGDPKIDAKVFIAENDTLGVEIGTRDFSIEKTNEGFDLYIVTKSGTVVKELGDERVFSQLIFTPLNESSRAYMNGELVGKRDDGERIYRFSLESNFDIDREGGLFLTNFTMFGQTVEPVATPLLGEFELVMGVVDYDSLDYKPSDIDIILDDTLIPGDAVGVSHERLRIRFGWHLDRLWSNSRTVSGTKDYLRYTTDVPAVYAENVYERDPVTGLIKIELDSEGNVVYNLIHSAGDPILDNEGNVVYAHRAGEVILGTDGEPILASPRKLVRQVDLLMVEGNYYFATEPVATSYRETIPSTYVSWLTEDLRRVSSNLLEQTEMFFYPQDTQGDISVIVEEGSEVVIRAEQSFKVTFYLTRTGYANIELRNILSQLAIDTISQVLERKIVTINDIVSKLTASSGDDVIAVDVKGLGGEEDYQAVTVVDDSARLSIKKRLISLPDNTLTVEDDVEIFFIRHEV